MGPHASQAFVEPDNLAQQTRILHGALDDRADRPRFVYSSRRGPA
jgi:hypothetical protein